MSSNPKIPGPPKPGEVDGNTLTGSAIDWYGALSLLGALRIHAETGVRWSRFVTPGRIAKKYGLKGRTAKAVFNELRDALVKSGALRADDRMAAPLRPKRDYRKEASGGA